GSNLSQLQWFDRDGKQEGPVFLPDQYSNIPSFSPDGKKFAIQIVDGEYSEVWLYDSTNGSRSKLTFAPCFNTGPRWSPDGSRILFGSDRNGPINLYVRDAQGSGNDERLYETKSWCLPDDWSPDGQYIIHTQIDPKSKLDLWVLRLGKPAKMFPYLITDAN